MKLKKITLIYLYTYLALGGIGFAFFPDQILKLFLSTGNYGDIMPRLVGMFMCALSYLIYKIQKHNDWKYYSTTILVRSGIVVFLFWLHYRSGDPMFIIVNVIVLVGLIPSAWIYFKNIS